MSAPSLTPRRGPSPTLRVCALYPELLNIYADRGNLLVLARRCAWRGIGFELAGSSLGQPLRADAHDLFYIGGGQDRDQRLCAADLLETKREALHAAAAAGALVVGVCGGYQLLGRSYALHDEEIEGVGLLDVRTVREPGPRLIGNIAIEVSPDVAGATASRGAPDPRDPPGDRGGSRGGTPEPQHAPEQRAAGRARVLAGFENHAGRTYLGACARPLGRVLRGRGNDGRSGWEGARQGNTLGTYMHGPLMPKNSWFADWLIATAIGLDPGELAPLDDALEREAHLSARRAAGV
jgi:lipid II isoglutaminyl synthase (glutamine-hydrolysing)